MRVEVIHHEREVISSGNVTRQYVFAAMCPVDFCASIRSLHMTPTSKGGKQHQQMTHTSSFIFILVARRLARFGSQRLTGFDHRWFTRLLQTKKWILRRRRTVGDIQDIFPGPDQFGIGLRRSAPWLF